MVDPPPRTSSRTRTVPRRLAGTTAADDKNNKNKNTSNPAAARATSAVHHSLVSPTPCTVGATALPASSLLPSSSSTSSRNEPTPSSTTVTPSQLLVASSSSSKSVVEKKGGRNNTRNSDSNSNGNEDDDNSESDSDTNMSVVDLTALSSDEEDEEAGDRFPRKLPPQWKCPRCTLLNDNAASMCTACEYNPIEDEDDDATTWPCSECTLVNPNTDTQCNACGAAAPGSSSSSTSSSSSDIGPAIGTEHTAKTQVEETRMLAELPNGRITTKREPNLKRKNTEISATDSAGAGIGRGLRTKKTKRIKREADSNRKKGKRNTSRNRNDVHDDDDDDDVVVSAVVEARRNKKKRRDGTRTRTGSHMDGLGRVAAALATNDTDADVDDDVVLEGVVNETKLPHSRADCVECSFVTMKMRQSNSIMFHGSTGSIVAAKDQNKNYCEMCYCYVCDTPASDCKAWYCASPYTTAHSSHCSAVANTEPWKSMRQKHKADAKAKQARAAIATATIAARAAATAARNNSSASRATAPPRAPTGFHFMHKCPKYPRITTTKNGHEAMTTRRCKKCWCFVCNIIGSECRRSESHTKADPTSLRWQIQRELIEYEPLIQSLPTYKNPGPFPPNNALAIEDAVLDKSLVQCQHCHWFVKFGNPAASNYLRTCMEENTISSNDWCMNCGLVASKIDFEKDQAGPIANIVDDDDVGDTDTIIRDIKPKVGEKSGTKKKPKRQPTVQIPPFLLGTKEISFTIKPHDPRKMKKYRENWNNGDGLVFDPSKQKREVFLHRIGKRPRLKNILKYTTAVSSAHIPIDPKEDDNKSYRGWSTPSGVGTAATIEDTDAIIIKNEKHLQLLNLLQQLDKHQGLPEVEASWEASKNIGTITVKLYLPKTAFIDSNKALISTQYGGICHSILIQPAVISLWCGIAFTGGQLCGSPSLKITSAPKINFGSDSILLKSKAHKIKIDKIVLKKSTEKLKSGQKQIEKDRKNHSQNETTQSLVPSYTGRQRFLYHGGGVPTDTSLNTNLTRYFREMFPHLISSQSDENLLSIHHGHQISNHQNNGYDPDQGFVLDALVGVKDAIAVRSLFSKDARAAKDYKSAKLSSQTRVAQFFASLESLGHDSEEHVDGLNVSLLPFQKQALKWAIERETLPDGIQSFYWPKLSDDPPLYYNPLLHKFRKDKPAIVRGGFLAQEMGLGKTVISLALILKNPPPRYPISGSKIDLLQTSNTAAGDGTAVTTTSAAALPALPVPEPKDTTENANAANENRIGWDTDLYKKTSVGNKKRGSIISGGTLVICPVSLVGQWIAEAKEKLSDPGLVYPYHGQNRKRNPIILSKNSIVVTTYNVVASDAFYHSAKGGANYCPPLEMVRWWRIICDEGHCLKESSTNLTKATFDIVGDKKWIVSGTPMNTRVFDIKNQMKFLGIENVHQMFNASGNTSAASSRSRNYSAQSVIPEHILYMLKPILLRHAQNQKYTGTDTTLMSLPPKTERTIDIKLDDEENEEYKKIEKKAQTFYLEFRASHSSTMSKHFLKISQKLTPLRVACSGGKYPLEDETKGNNSNDDTDIEDDDDEDGQKKKKKAPLPKVYSKFAFTSKFRVLLKELQLIRDTDNSSKSLVFSQFNSTLAYLQEELPKHGFQFRTLQGSMSMKQRAKALNDFQNDPPTTVFLLSMRAGAVGINLTQANRVFLMEPSFNPALEAQAIGRVHRLGQKREVNVARLVVLDCLEERIMKFLYNKYHSNTTKNDKSKKDDTNADAGKNNDGDGKKDKEKRGKKENKKKGRGKPKDDDDSTNNEESSIDSAKEEKKEDKNDDDEEENEVGGVVVGNLFREKAEIVMEEFDQLFGVSSLAEQQQAEAKEDDEVGQPDFIGSNEVDGLTPDHVGSENVAAPDYIGSS